MADPSSATEATYLAEDPFRRIDRIDPKSLIHPGARAAERSRQALCGSPSTPAEAHTTTPRHIMHGCACPLPKPKSRPLADSRLLTFGRPPHRRLWRGCAALVAGVEADPRGARCGTQRNLWGRLLRRSDVGGMKRKAPTPISFYTERSLAAYLTVSDRTIRNWIRRGDLPSYKLGAARRIDPADVEDFLARHRDEAS